MLEKWILPIHFSRSDFSRGLSGVSGFMKCVPPQASLTSTRADAFAVPSNSAIAINTRTTAKYNSAQKQKNRRVLPRDLAPAFLGPSQFREGQWPLISLFGPTDKPV